MKIKTVSSNKSETIFFFFWFKRKKYEANLTKHISGHYIDYVLHVMADTVDGEICRGEMNGIYYNNLSSTPIGLKLIQQVMVYFSI